MKKKSPKSGRRLPLPEKAGGPMGTKRGAKGYRRRDSGVEDLAAHEISADAPAYEIIDHTADLGIRVYGESLEKVFENAGLAVFDLLVDFRCIRPTSQMSLSMEAEDVEALLVQWLRELLHLFYGQKRLFRAFEIIRLTQTCLSVTGWGERFDPKRHIVLAEIKAVTYHELAVSRTESGWVAQVIFDV
ncbi:MAG: archease [Candidatus Eiseniibacteriota bacterium]|nr:MAG: archease [Candidatus Eisenbacteria bacterium]